MTEIKKSFEKAINAYYMSGEVDITKFTLTEKLDPNHNRQLT